MDIFGTAFKNTFGFRPSPVRGMYDHEQEIVGNKLKYLAECFSSSSGMEEEVRRGKPAKGDSLKETRDNLQAHAKQLKDAAGMVAWTKKDFWRAHKLAKSRKYFVQTKYTDYLEQIRNRR